MLGIFVVLHRPSLSLGLEQIQHQNQLRLHFQQQREFPIDSHTMPEEEKALGPHRQIPAALTAVQLPRILTPMSEKSTFFKFCEISDEKWV
jgi:hypothetical protein